jgi:hypothetical protein
MNGPSGCTATEARKTDHARKPRSTRVLRFLKPLFQHRTSHEDEAITISRLNSSRLKGQNRLALSYTFTFQIFEENQK